MHGNEGELKLELLLDLGARIAREVALDELLITVGERVARALRADRATLWLVDAATDELRSRVADLPELDELRLPIGRGVAGYVARTGEIVNIRDAASDARWAPEIDHKTGYRTRSMLCVPIFDHDRADRDRAGAPEVPAVDRLRGVVQVLNKAGGGAFTERDEVFLAALADQIARAISYTSLRAHTARGVSMRGRFNHIIGSSPVMNAVYDQIVRAAATGATVLLHGETGTGKGLLARAIHVNSDRRDGPLVQVDCTNLPASLVESELFGHERGAYTGADSRVEGKVELAAGGTLFLDEIGELPLPLQGKLLRFLQERQFERVGGRKTLTADVRFVAATNRDLAQMVKAGEFRSDLYYRVRVIDIELPPLRSRGPDDILALAEHFVGLYARRYHKPAARLSERARHALVRHRWPGNVRELEHALERAIVLSDGELLEAHALGLVPVEAVRGDPDLGAGSARGSASTRERNNGGSGPGPVREPDGADGVVLPHGLTLEEVERAYAAAAVDQADGNRSAAARALGIGRNKLARLLRADTERA